MIADIGKYVPTDKHLFWNIDENIINKRCRGASNSSWFIDCWNEITTLKSHKKITAIIRALGLLKVDIEITENANLLTRSSELLDCFFKIFLKTLR